MIPPFLLIKIMEQNNHSGGVSLTKTQERIFLGLLISVVIVCLIFLGIMINNKRNRDLLAEQRHQAFLIRQAELQKKIDESCKILKEKFNSGSFCDKK